MSRVDENNETLKIIADNKSKMMVGTSNELICWHLGTIGTLLADISVSLAEIADNLKEESDAT